MFRLGIVKSENYKNIYCLSSFVRTFYYGEIDHVDIVNKIYPTDGPEIHCEHQRDANSNNLNEVPDPSDPVQKLAPKGGTDITVQCIVKSRPGPDKVRWTASTTGETVEAKKDGENYNRELGARATMEVCTLTKTLTQ